MKYLMLIAWAWIGAWAQQAPIRIPDGAGGMVEVVASGEDDFVLESNDEGATWKNLAIPGKGDLFYFASSSSGDTLYAARTLQPFGHVRSCDGGQSWQSADAIDARSRVVLDPGDPKHLFAYFIHEIQESFDAGQTWRRIEGNLPWTRVSLSLGPWIDRVVPDSEAPLGPVVRTWAGWFVRSNVRDWRSLPVTQGMPMPAAFAILPGDRFLAQFGEELWIYDNYLQDPLRIPSPQYFKRFVADAFQANRVYGLAGASQFVSDDYGRTWSAAASLIPELTSWIAGKPVASLTRHGRKYFAVGPQSTDLRISRTDASGKVVFDWIYPLRGVQQPVRPAVAPNGEIYIAGRTNDETPTDFIWRLNAAGDYLSGYQFEPRGDFQEVRLEPTGEVILAGTETEIRFDRELNRLLP